MKLVLVQSETTKLLGSRKNINNLKKMRLPVVTILCLCLYFNGVSLHPQSSLSRSNDNESLKALHEAIETGNENEFKRLLMNGVNLNTTDENGNSPLLLAAEKGHVSMVRLLIENGANINAFNINNNTALIFAAYEGHGNVAELLIQNGANVNAVGALENTALILATTRGSVKTVQMLIENGANVNAMDNGKRTALMHAAINEFESIIRLLVDNGADINAVDTGNQTALILTIMEENGEIAELLIQKGADVNIVGHDGRTALIWASMRGLAKIVRMIIEKGADINAVDKDQNSALFNTALYGIESTGHDLLLGLHIENGTENLITAYSDEDTVADILVASGANINATNSNGDTALILAADNGGVDMMKLLIKHGANINAVNNNNESALILAIGWRRWTGEYAAARLLIENGADPNVGSKNNDSALIVAISREDVEPALLFIQHGADINAVGSDGFTPLMRSVNEETEEVAHTLIIAGANINATNYVGASALNLAVRIHEVNISKWLIEYGADINHKDENGRTPLMEAVSQVVSPECSNECQGSKEILQLLIDKGANVNAVDKDGYTALDVVLKSNENKEIKRMLTEHGAERGATLLYRKTAWNACRLYSNLTFRWNYANAGRESNESLAKIGEFPWMVALGHLSSKYKVSFSCGGSLISDTFVLTAAHCVRDDRLPVVARLGIVTLSDENNFQAENQNIREIIPHPEYSSDTRKNDIALIGLIERLFITKLIQPVCIKTRLRDEPAQTNLIATGWGQINRSSTSNELLKFNLKTISLSQCNEIISNYNKDRNLPEFQYGIDETKYCACDRTGSRVSSCQGGSGEPLKTTQTFSNPAILIGITSFNTGCGCGYPGIYMRVAHYIEWIGTHVWPDGKIQTPQVYNRDDDYDDSEEYIFSSK